MAFLDSKQNTAVADVRSMQMCRANGCRGCNVFNGLCDWHADIDDSPENWSALSSFLNEKRIRGLRKWLYFAQVAGDLGVVNVVEDKYNPREGGEKPMRGDDCLGYALIIMRELFPTADLTIPEKNKWGKPMTKHHFSELLMDRLHAYTKRRFGRSEQGSRHSMDDKVRADLSALGVFAR